MATAAGSTKIPAPTVVLMMLAVSSRVPITRTSWESGDWSDGGIKDSRIGGFQIDCRLLIGDCRTIEDCRAKYNPDAPTVTYRMYQRLKSPLRACAAFVAVAGGGWALAIWLLGGVRTQFVTASNPWRALWLAAGGALVFLIVNGPAEMRRQLRDHGPRFVTPVALMLAICPAIAGLAHNSWTAGGADSYAYVSQADLWLDLKLKTSVPLA